MFNNKLSEEERMALCVKEVVRQSLWKIEQKKEERRKIVSEIQYLKMDVRDFKAGRLDRIFERHQKDPDAEKASIMEIEKLPDQNYNKSKWSPYYLVRFLLKEVLIKVKIPGFFFHEHTPGTYTLDEDTIKNL